MRKQTNAEYDLFYKPTGLLKSSVMRKKGRGNYSILNDTKDITQYNHDSCLDPRLKKNSYKKVEEIEYKLYIRIIAIFLGVIMALRLCRGNVIILKRYLLKCQKC